jgi:hypothetical protein
VQVERREEPLRERQLERVGDAVEIAIHGHRGARQQRQDHQGEADRSIHVFNLLKDVVAFDSLQGQRAGQPAGSVESMT